MKIQRLLLSAALILCSTWTWAQSYQEKIDPDLMQTNASLEVIDDHAFTNSSSCPAGMSWESGYNSLDENIFSATGLVKLNVPKEIKLDVASRLEYQFDLQVEYMALSTDCNTKQTENISLTIEYDPEGGTVYKDIAIKKYEDVHWLKVSITTITDLVNNTVVTDVEDVFKLTGTIDVTRFDDFDPQGSLTSSCDLEWSQGSIVPVGPGGPCQLIHFNNGSIEFHPVEFTGAEYYDIEWTWIDPNVVDANGAVSAAPPAEIEFSFRNNASRVRISSDQLPYSIANTFGEGYIALRYRAWGRPGVADVYQYTEWFPANQADQKEIIVNNYAVAFIQQIFIGHEEDKNWQFITTFSEEGKRKEVITYYDGLNKNRQAVTQLPSTGTTIVGQTIYDHEGRPAVQVLPVPIEDKDELGYETNVNPAVSGSQYGPLDFDGKNQPDEMATDPAMKNGASKYYSTDNGFTGAPLNDYIPDAEGFPFSQTVYTNDGTGRALAQSGVGAKHKIGSGYETTYEYAKPNQVDLAALFGSEVGEGSHYKETIVVDPNGQMSVSYIDQHGRVIATSLSGTPDPTSDLINLAASAPVSDVIPLHLANNRRIPDAHPTSYELIYPYVAKADGDHEFWYEFQPEDYVLTCNSICFDCYYDLEIRMVDANGDEVFSETMAFEPVGTINTDCDNGDLLTLWPGTGIDDGAKLVENLEKGKYYIYKTLTINSDHLDEYWELYRDEADNCLYDYDYFFDYAYNELPGCDDLEEIPADPGPAQCQTFRSLMISDFTPGGQYASTDRSEDYDGNYVDPLFQVSIFNEENSLDEYKNIFWDNFDEAVWNAPYTQYLDENGDRTTINDVGDRWVYPEDYASYQALADNWKPSYSESLVRFHPEYPYYYLMCELPEFQGTFEYDDEVIATKTMAEAVTKGYIKPSDQNAIVDIDPIMVDLDHDFWKSSAVIKDNSIDPVKADWDDWYADEVKQQLNYAITNAQHEKDENGVASYYHLETLAARLQCAQEHYGDDLATWACENVPRGHFNNNSYNTAAQLDEQWQIYANLYLGRKSEAIYRVLDIMVRHLYNKAGGGPFTNGDIGNAGSFESAVARFRFDQLMDLGVKNAAGEEIDITDDADDPDYDDLKDDLDDVYNIELRKRATLACEGQVAQWMEKLNNCSYLSIVNGKDYEALSGDLTKVCMNSYSPERLMGGREDNPLGDDLESTSFSSIHEVLVDYFGPTYATTYCNIDIIDDELVSNDHALTLREIKREEDCACDYLEKVVEETVKQEEEKISVLNSGCSDNEELIQSFLNDLVNNGFAIQTAPLPLATSSSNGYSTLHPGPSNAEFTYGDGMNANTISVFANEIGVDIVANPGDRIEYQIVALPYNVLRISVRKHNTNNKSNSFTITLSEWSGTTMPVGKLFYDVGAGGTADCIDCQQFNIWLDGKHYQGQLSLDIATCDKIEVKTLIESVRNKLLSIDGTDLTNGQVISLIESCEKTLRILPEVTKKEVLVGCKVSKFYPTKKQLLMVQHLNDVAAKLELKTNDDKRGYQCDYGPYDYLIDQPGYETYIRSIMVSFDPFNNYHWGSAHNADFDPSSEIVPAEFFFGTHFITSCDNWEVDQCYASLGYLDANDAGTPISTADRDKIILIDRLQYDYDRGFWTVTLTLDQGAGQISERKMHFITCDEGFGICLDQEWLTLSYDCTAPPVVSTDKFDFVCECEQPKFDEFFEELRVANIFLEHTQETDVSAYTSIFANESINHLKAYNISTSTFEYQVKTQVVPTSTQMNAMFGDIDGDHCNLYIQVDPDANPPFTLGEIQSFDGTRFNTERMDQEGMTGVNALRYGSAHYIIDVTVAGQPQEIFLYSDCYLTPCEVFNTKTVVISEEIRAGLPCPSCIDCKELKTEVEGFVAEYPSIGYNHALFPTLLTRYLNTSFNTNRAFPEYQEYISNCRLSADAMPGYTTCHLSFTLSGPNADDFEDEFGPYATLFEEEHQEFIKYSVIDHGTSLEYCFDFSNQSSLLAGKLMKDLGDMEIDASNSTLKVWGDYPDPSTGYPNAQENTMQGDVHRIEIPTWQVTDYETALGALTSTYGKDASNNDYVQVSSAFSISTASNGGLYSPYSVIEIDYSNVVDGEMHLSLIEDIIAIMETSNLVDITFGRMYYSYQNVRHEGFEICETPETDCETCEDIRDVVLNYVYESEGDINDYDYLQGIDIAIKTDLGIDVESIRSIDNCESCADRDLYVCESPSNEAVDMVAWLNELAIGGMANGGALSGNAAFLNASFYPNTPVDNPIFTAAASADGSGLSLMVSDDKGYSLTVKLYTENDAALDFNKITQLNRLEVVADKRGVNYSFKLLAYSATDNEFYQLGGNTFSFAIANCCYFNDLELCYRPQLPLTEWEREDCVEYKTRIAAMNAEVEYNKYLEKERNTFFSEYREACSGAFSNNLEKFEMRAPNVSHHYTLYYYDQAGNLVQTVPPKGVTKLDPTQSAASANNPGAPGYQPEHKLNTFYQYNSLNAPTWQHTPDGGEKQFYYSKSGQVLFSQNAEQITQGNVYAYYIYDEMGRRIEAGEILLTTPVDQLSLLTSNVYYTSLFSFSPKTQVTYVQYDEPYSTSISTEFGPNGQKNLRNRVASTFYKEDGSAQDYDYATHYSYDFHGMVNVLIQDYPELADIGHRFKRIDYEYDLISGNVNAVYYQKEKADQFIHKYVYDDDNRIEEVFTSRDGLIWDRDAKYKYYLHGPLARTQMGDNDVQGLDFAYTIQGWLKGVNSATLVAAKDPGQDLGDGVARDAYGYNLHYYDGDYKAIGTSVDFLPALGTSTLNGGEYGTKGLYNGNISAMTTGNRTLQNEGKDILGQNFQYDQLNRLVSSSTFLMDATQAAAANSSWDGIASANKWGTDYQYDANGNLLKTTRRGHKPVNIVMDELDYDYYDESNRLKSVDELANSTAGDPNYATREHHAELFSQKEGGVEDIDPGQDVVAGNYFYDAIGNLVKDVQEEIDDMQWTVSGKVKKVLRSPNSVKSEMEFAYGPAGNRIVKIEKKSGRELDWRYQYYVYDAGGHVMAVYEKLLKVEDDAVNYETIGDWLEAYNGVGKQTVYDMLSAAYGDNEVFKDKLITELSNNGLEATLGQQFTLAELLSWDETFAEETFKAYDANASSFDFMLQEMIGSSTFKSDFIDGIWQHYPVVALQILLGNDPSDDFLQCQTLTDLNQLISDMYVGPPSAPVFGTVTAAIAHLRATYSDGQLASGLYSHLSLKSKDALKTCVANSLMTGAWSYTNWVALNPAMNDVYDDVLASMDLTDLAAWMATDPDATTGRMLNYLSMNVNGFTLLTTIATNDGDAFINKGLAVLNNLSTTYSNILPGIEGNSPSYWTYVVKLEMGEVVYGQMMDDIADELDYAQSFKTADYPIYGSSRLGSKQAHQVLVESSFTATGTNNDGTLVKGTLSNGNIAQLPGNGDLYQRTLGEKQYELSNHLGNVLATITDRKVLTENPNSSDPNDWWWDADVISAQDYYPFGMLMPDRVYSRSPKAETITIERIEIQETIEYDQDFALNLNGSSGAGGMTVSLDNGRLKAVSTTLPNRTVSTYVTEAGKKYKVRIDLDRGTCNEISLWILAKNPNNTIATLNDIDDGIVEYEFTATSAETKVLLMRMDGSGAGTQTFYIDRITLYEVNEVTIQETVEVECAKGYRYGFNGMERLDDWNGAGNSYDFGARIYNSRIGRWLSTDNFEKKHPSHTPYNYAVNNPVFYIDPDGNEEKTHYVIITDHGTAVFTVVHQENVAIRVWEPFDQYEGDGAIVFRNSERLVVKDQRTGIPEGENQSYTGDFKAGSPLPFWIGLKQYVTKDFTPNTDMTVEGGIHWYHSGADGIMGQGQESTASTGGDYMDIADILGVIQAAMGAAKGPGPAIPIPRTLVTQNAYWQATDVLTTFMDVEGEVLSTLLDMIGAYDEEGNAYEVESSVKTGTPSDTVIFTTYFYFGGHSTQDTIITDVKGNVLLDTKAQRKLDAEGN